MSWARRIVFGATSGALLVTTLSGAWAAPTAAQRCEGDRAKALAKYLSCEKGAEAKTLLTLKGFTGEYVGKCAAKLNATWVKIQATASGSGTVCDNPRFGDNGDGTVTDRLTRLQWERKTNLGPSDPHDVVQRYTWTSGPAGETAADGTVFSVFLAGLNGACFASHCDWRLPSPAELATIVSPPFPGCSTPPCVVSELGPAVANSYWTDTTAVYEPSPFTLGAGAYAEVVSFGGTWLYQAGVGALKSSLLYVRAVRAAP